MKKVLSVILCVIFLMSVCASTVTAAVAGDDPKNQVKIAKGTPVIDGIMDDCYKAADKITTPYPNDAVDGTDFATFEGYLVYDSEAVYLWGHISDPTLSANSNSWNGDGVEVFFNYDLVDGVGADDDADPYGDTGCMQFRIIPIPIDDQERYENSSGHGLDDEVTEDLEKNPGNYYCAVDADNKGYVIECRFPIASAKKALVKDGFAIGFSIQINDAQDGTPTEEADRTGTIHFQDGDQMEQCWQYAGAMGRAFFTDLSYIVPVAETPDIPAPAEDGGNEDAVVITIPAPAPQTGDNGLILFVLAIILAGAFVTVKRVGKNRA